MAKLKLENIGGEVHLSVDELIEYQKKLGELERQEPTPKKTEGKNISSSIEVHLGDHRTERQENISILRN